MNWRIVSLLLVAGCGAPREDLSFPKGFLFGSAIAGFQVEMGCPTVPASECEDPNSDWYVFVTHPELVGEKGLHLSGHAPSMGPGFYETYPQDIQRAATEMHHNALRFSIEWSRVFPKSALGVDDPVELAKRADPKALAFYHAVLSALKARGLRPLVTINHYALPTWIHDALGCHRDLDACKAKGWVDRALIQKEMARYAGFLGREFGAEVDLWATLNEPLSAVVVTGYLFQTAQRTNPPGVAARWAEARTTAAAMIEAHARMYDAVKAADTVDADGDGRAARVGIVYNLQPAVPMDPDNAQDVQGAKSLEYVMNQAFLDGVGKGDLDEDLDGKAEHRDDLARRLDFLGVNYYARAIVAGTPSAAFPKLSPYLTANLLTLQIDFAYPRGIYEVLLWAKRYGVPLLITETGAEDKEDKGDAARWLVETMTWVKRAMRDGVPVEGYFYWTLMDNYEWNHGMNIKLGLYAVDPADKTKARRARKSVAAFDKIASTGSIPADLAAQYPAK